MKRSVLLLMAFALTSAVVACADDEVLPGIEREHGEDDVGDVPGGDSRGQTGSGTAVDASATSESDGATENDAAGDAEADSGADTGAPDDSGADGA